MKMGNISKYKKIIIIITLLSVIGLISGIFVGRLNFFRVRQIYIESDLDISLDEIIELSGINIGKSIFFIDFNQAKKSIEKYWIVKKVGFEIIKYSILKIKIYSRHPVVQINGKFGCDIDGYILPMEELSDLLKVYINDKNISGRIIPPYGYIIEPAILYSNNYDFSMIDKMFIDSVGLWILSTDSVVVKIGNNSFVQCYDVLNLLYESKWWDKRYLIDMSVPGEVLITNRIN